MPIVLSATTLITILLLVVSLASFGIGIGVYRHDRRKMSSRYFGLMAISVGFWVMGRALLQLTDVTGFAQIWGYFLFIPPTLLTLFLFLFSVYIGDENKILSRRQKFIIYGPWLILFIFTLLPGTTSEEVIRSGSENLIIYGDLFFKIYLPLLVGYLLAMFPILIKKYRKAGTLLKVRLRYILFGTFISVVAAVGANLILPSFGIVNLVWLGPLVAIVLVAIVGYAITRKELWDFKLIVTELLVVVILLILLIDIFLAADDVGKVVFKSTAFLLTTVFSYFLIRGIFKEIEARENVRELTQELENANTRLKEIDVEKSTFVSIASHQLRTPLTVIKGYASMLLEGSFGKIDDESIKKIIENIFDASERLVGMIEDFLDISRIEQGNMSYKFSRIDLGTLIWSVVNEQETASKTMIEGMFVHIDKNKDFPIMGDALKVRQVINNLLDNAIKYSPKSAPIDINLEERDGKIQFEIKDNGIGISKKAMDKLFQKFSRADVTEKLHTEGRGLGLYIAKQIMNAHGGRIWAKSGGEGKGSTFYLEFNKFSPRNRVEVDSGISKVNIV